MPYRLGANLLENSFAEKNLGIWVEQLNRASSMPWSQRQPPAPGWGTLPLAQHWGGSAAGLGHCWAPLCRDTHWNKSSELR